MVKTFVLPNGLVLVLEKIPFVRSVSFGIWVKNGSRNERENTCGISHFIEHMLFKGTESRTAAQIADEIDAVGGQLNAYTSKEYTCYYTRTLDTHFDIALDVMGDMFFHSKFGSDDIKKECNVIFEEINMYEDSPEELVHDILQMNIWKQDPLGYPILGKKESISGLDRQTFQEYYRNNYQPSNTVVAVAGNFEEGKMLEALTACFSGFSGLSAIGRAPVSFSGYTPCRVVKEKDIEQVHLAMSFEGIPVGSEDSQCMAILNTVFGGGMSSRLFQKIREEMGLVYSVYSYHAAYSDTGLFTIYAGLNPEHVERVTGLVLQEIEGLFKDPIKGLVLDRAKEQLKSNYLMGLESTASRMSSIGKSQLMLNKIYTQEEIIEKVDRVSAEDLYDLAKKIFSVEKLSIAAVGELGGLSLDGLF